MISSTRKLNYPTKWKFTEYLVWILIWSCIKLYDYQQIEVTEYSIIKYRPKWRVWSPTFWIIILMSFIYDWYRKGLKQSYRETLESIESTNQDMSEKRFELKHVYPKGLKRKFRTSLICYLYNI